MKILPALTPSLTAWARQQPLFFVASAPLHGRHVNVSPKGLPSSSLAFLSPSRVAYVDVTGSGCETVAHLYENGRATLMFASFGARPNILRLYCTGSVVEHDDPAFAAWLERMGCARPHAARAVVVLDVWRVTTSCGYGVPRVKRGLYEPFGEGDGAEEEGEGEGEEIRGVEKGRGECSVFEERSALQDFWRTKEKKGEVLEYQSQKNVSSLDGLPGLRAARRAARQRLWAADVRARMRRALAERDGIFLGFALALAVYVLVTSQVFAMLAEMLLHQAQKLAARRG